jgi:hypothetical protein
MEIEDEEDEEDDRVYYVSSVGDSPTLGPFAVDELATQTFEGLKGSPIISSDGWDCWVGFTELMQGIVTPETAHLEDVFSFAKQLATSGGNRAYAVLFLHQMIEVKCFPGGVDEPLELLGTLELARLLLDTLSAINSGRRDFLSQSEPGMIEFYPCLELETKYSGEKECNWGKRWRKAARAAKDRTAAKVYAQTKRMVARKDSEIWNQLGNFSLFPDALGNAFPPFALNAWTPTSELLRNKCIELGIITNKSRPVKPPRLREYAHFRV